ncbi:MAG: methyltransferase domain-containing protein [Alphaproteobacteria bacterium]|jgi:SAM-dependent methyltransferase|nr:methyltransferase domain-containing protein [Alphaproteobacteria bacterium]
MANAPVSQPFIDGAVRWANALGAVAEGDARWRRALAADVNPQDCDVILDVRCGHGALTLALAEAAPKAIVMGLDHRPEALARTRAKAAQSGRTLHLIDGHARDVASYVNELRPTKIICALSAEDAPTDRRHILAALRAALAPRGTLHLMEAVGPAPPLLARLLGAPPAPDDDAAMMMDMMRQAGFVGVMTLGLFPGQGVMVRLLRGTAP